MTTADQLAEMSNQDNTKSEASNLVDIDSVNIDTSLPVVQRMESYLAQIKNPYCFICAGTTVKIVFSPEARPLEDKLLDFFVGLKSR